MQTIGEAQDSWCIYVLGDVDQYEWCQLSLEVREEMDF